MIYEPTTINCRGTLIDLKDPIVLGILNVTPDSFYDGGRYQQLDAILSQVWNMIEEGASIIDIGGMSSRPGAPVISAETELARVLPAIQKIRQNFPDAILSLDTVHAKVAKAALDSGVHLLNDISAGSIDPELWNVVADYQVPYILMHMQGKPENMQEEVIYDDLLTEIIDFFIEKIGQLRALGIKDIVIDPGFGFGKTIAHNFELLKNMHVFKILECPILAGISRKSFIYKTLNTNPESALHGSTALHMVALQQGAKILRAHDVKPAMETIKLWKALQEADPLPK